MLLHRHGKMTDRFADVTGLTASQCKLNFFFPTLLIERVINRYITAATQSNLCPQGSLLTTSPTFYFKPSCTGHFPVLTTKRDSLYYQALLQWLTHLTSHFSFQIDNMFGVKDPIPGGLRSRVWFYKFVCAGCNACYVGEAVRHFFIFRENNSF